VVAHLDLDGRQTSHTVQDEVHLIPGRGSPIVDGIAEAGVVVQRPQLLEDPGLQGGNR
jgi:hypothetical protein